MHISHTPFNNNQLYYTRFGAEIYTSIIKLLLIHIRISLEFFATTSSISTRLRSAHLFPFVLLILFLLELYY